jgi:hypothetical protein
MRCSATISTRKPGARRPLRAKASNQPSSRIFVSGSTNSVAAASTATTCEPMSGAASANKVRASRAKRGHQEKEAVKARASVDKARFAARAVRHCRAGAPHPPTAEAKARTRVRWRPAGPVHSL